MKSQMNVRNVLILIGCLVSGLSVMMVLSSEQPARAQNDPGRRVRLRGEVKPAFRISPLVHRFEARRGQSIPFVFEVESLGQETTLQIEPVSLIQRENGAIVPDTDSPPPENIRMTSPASMQLRAGQQAEIKGRVAVPLVDSPFHTFGLLVTDLGRIVGTQEVDSADGDGKSRIGIKFITRYLLRFDIVVTNASGLNARLLQLQDGELIETEAGQPQARVWVHNPTDRPFEFEVHCRLNSALGKRGTEFPLVLPIRAKLDPPDRFRARILPNSRVRLNAPLPEPVFPGRYTLHAELYAAKRKQISQDFAISVGDHDFPAQSATVVQIAEAVTVTPTQIEFSLRRRGSRLIPLTVRNGSAQPMAIRIKTRPFHAGESPSNSSTVHLPARTQTAPMDWLIVRPESFSLRPNQMRKVLVAVRSGEEIEGHRYGFLQVHANPETGTAVGQHDIPVALLSRSKDVHKLKLGELLWQFDEKTPAFVLPVTNEGTIHIPLNARLAIADAFDRPVELKAGFDRWLLPGDSDELIFRTRPLKPGPYKLQVRVERPGEEPLIIDQEVEIPSHPASDVDAESELDDRVDTEN